VGLILESVVQRTWESNPDVWEEYSMPVMLLDEMRDIRWYGYPDGTSRMGTFLSSQVKVCDLFGIEVPEECRPVRKRNTQGRKSAKIMGRVNQPARNKVV